MTREEQFAFADLVKNYRQNLQCRQKTVADVIGVSQSVYSKIEHGYYPVRRDHVDKALAYLDSERDRQVAELLTRVDHLKSLNK